MKELITEEYEAIKWFLEFLEQNAEQDLSNLHDPCIRIEGSFTENYGLCGIAYDLTYFNKYPPGKVWEPVIDGVIERLGPPKNWSGYHWEMGMLEPRLEWLRSLL